MYLAGYPSLLLWGSPFIILFVWWNVRIQITCKTNRFFFELVYKSTTVRKDSSSYIISMKCPLYILQEIFCYYSRLDWESKHNGLEHQTILWQCNPVLADTISQALSVGKINCLFLFDCYNLMWNCFYLKSRAAQTFEGNLCLKSLRRYIHNIPPHHTDCWR